MMLMSKLSRAVTVTFRALSVVVAVAVDGDGAAGRDGGAVGGVVGVAAGDSRCN